jgi:putative transposase
MPHPRRLDDALYTHFITFSGYHRRRLLDHDRCKQTFLGVLNEVREKFTARCVGFVLMPDHVHLLIWFPQPRQLSPFVQQLKGRSSTQIKRFLRDGLVQYAARISPADPVWQVRFYSFEIDGQKKLEEKLTYMHLNPVRAGLVARMIDWQWSSARWYEERQSVEVPIEPVE